MLNNRCFDPRFPLSFHFFFDDCLARYTIQLTETRLVANGVSYDENCFRWIEVHCRERRHREMSDERQSVQDFSATNLLPCESLLSPSFFPFILADLFFALSGSWAACRFYESGQSSSSRKIRCRTIEAGGEESWRGLMPTKSLFLFTFLLQPYTITPRQLLLSNIIDDPQQFLSFGLRVFRMI